MGSGGHKPHEAIDISPGETLWTRIEKLTRTQGNNPEEEALLDAEMVAVSNPLIGGTNETLEVKLSTGGIAYFKPMDGTQASMAALNDAMFWRVRYQSQPDLTKKETTQLRTLLNGTVAALEPVLPADRFAALINRMTLLVNDRRLPKPRGAF